MRSGGGGVLGCDFMERRFKDLMQELKSPEEDRGLEGHMCRTGGDMYF